MTPEQETFWATGYFDARGGYHTRTSQVIIVFTDKDESVLRAFNKIIGHGWVRPYGKSNILQVGARSDVVAVTLRFRPLVTRESLIADMDEALADGRLREEVRRQSRA